MAKCTACGKKSLFLKVNENGFCTDCVLKSKQYNADIIMLADYLTVCETSSELNIIKEQCRSAMDIISRIKDDYILFRHEFIKYFDGELKDLENYFNKKLNIILNIPSNVSNEDVVKGINELNSIIFGGTIDQNTGEVLGNYEDYEHNAYIFYNTKRYEEAAENFELALKVLNNNAMFATKVYFTSLHLIYCYWNLRASPEYGRMLEMECRKNISHFKRNRHNLSGVQSTPGYHYLIRYLESIADYKTALIICDDAIKNGALNTAGSGFEKVRTRLQNKLNKK